jgi:aldehyde dehydrogenase (NAD+)
MTFTAIRGNEPAPYEGFESMPIGRRWREGRAGRRIAVLDPYRQETLLEIAAAGPADVDEAYRAAAEAQPAWAAAPLQQRCGVLEAAAASLAARREEIVGWLVRESGSTRAKARFEWELALAVLHRAAAQPYEMEGYVLPSSVPAKDSFSVRKPAGVVGVISPWNFPLHLTNRSLAPALAAGNAVVLKPASETPVTGGLWLAKLFEEAGLPPGVLNVVVGGGGDLGDSLVTHPVPRVISFTGSTEVGRRVGELAGRHLKRVCLELGGNTPCVVLADADLERAVPAAVCGKFLHAGQICMAINRLIVDRAVYAPFLERFTERVKALRVGDPASEDTAVGPLINRRQLERARALADQTIAAGARAVLDGPAQGLVMPPVILADVKNDMPAAQGELFAPVAVLIEAHGDDDAIELANATRAGLSAAVFSRDTGRALAAARRIVAGMTHVNDMPVHDDATGPFGGEKESGHGRYGGRWSLDEFTTQQWLTVQQAPRAYPF